MENMPFFPTFFLAGGVFSTDFFLIFLAVGSCFFFYAEGLPPFVVVEISSSLPEPYPRQPSPKRSPPITKIEKKIHPQCSFFPVNSPPHPLNGAEEWAFSSLLPGVLLLGEVPLGQEVRSVILPDPLPLTRGVIIFFPNPPLILKWTRTSWRSPSRQVDFFRQASSLFLTGRRLNATLPLSIFFFPVVLCPSADCPGSS